MNRRKFISAAAAAFGAFGVNPGWAEQTSSASSSSAPNNQAPQSHGKRPNVLVIMSDQHKRSCMGVAGDKVAVTPNLDRLARESVRFTNAYCFNPVCGPSRACFMTGLYTHSIDARGNSSAYSPRYKTVADQFNQAGYLSALIGKMHFVDAQNHGFRYKLEFNDWWQLLGPKSHIYANELGRPNTGAGMPQVVSLWQEEGNPWKGLYKPDGRLGTVAVGGPSVMAEEDHFEEMVARESIRFLNDYARQDEPFFLVSSFLKPHDPFMPAKRFADMFDPATTKLSPTWGKADMKHLPVQVQKAIELCHWTPELRHASAARARTAYYYGNLAQMDDCAGKILRELSRLGLDRNTIVIYTADHGEMLGDLGLWNKFQFYEGSCGIPLTVRMPGAAPGVCEAPVSLLSLRATLADLSGTGLPGKSDGDSFAHLVRSPRSSKDTGPIYAEYGLDSEQAKYMIRDGDYKYSFWVHDIDELYDLRNDPEEMHNLTFEPKYRKVADEMRAKLFAWHRPEELNKSFVPPAGISSAL